MTHDLTRRSFLKVVTAAGLAAPALTQRNGVLNHVTIGGSGMAASDIGFLMKDPRVRLHAIVDVDEVRSRPMREQFPKALYFRDWRELFAKEAGNFESCNIGTPDHMHAAIAMTAMRHGKHVYCQKPLCHTLFESRRLAEEAAARPKVVTQMGIQRHSEPQSYRQAVQLIQSGTIGPVHTVYSWCTSTRERAQRPAPPSQADPIPPELDWDLWLGVAEKRPYHTGYYHPGVWRSRPDFGEGLLGDFGPHVLDPVFTALELTAPRTIRSLGPAPTADSWPLESEVIYEFPATRRTASRGLTVGWTDGNRRPPRPMMSDLGEGIDELFPIGSAIIGTEGTMLLQHHSHPPRLFPEAKFRGVPIPELPERGHRIEFIDACFGLDRASAPFSYAGLLNEAVVAGTVAQRFPGERLAWDVANLRFDNVKANDHIRRPHRKGWEVEGL